VPIHRRIPATAVLVLAFTMVAGACQSGGTDRAARATPATGVKEVTAHALAFTPPAIQVPVGTTVTWRFQDGRVPHNVQGDGFKSANLTNTTFQHRFDRQGTFTYVCTLHAGMTGRVVVVAG
jgi:plastocyanin